MSAPSDIPEDQEAADRYGTLAPATRLPAHSPDAVPLVPKRPEAPQPPSSDTHTDDAFATMARPLPDKEAALSMPSSLPPPPPGLPFDKVGDYDILDKIGHGGMGLVLKARQRGLKRIVALKMIKLGQLADESEVARFLIEARAAAHLKHPNIVGVYDVGEHAGSPFFSMEYVEGQSLHKLISERPLQATRAATIMLKLALAVDYAHQSGILHRDLKPHNILLDKYEEPKITDFGLAASAEENSQLTATGTVLGTPSYMPPEQARGKSDEMGKWSDVYSLGATLYEALVGRPPFSAATLGETLQQVMSVDPVGPRTLNPAIPRDIETICLKCLEKAPARRYQTAGELAEELQRFLEDRPILARPTSRTEKFVRWCRRNPVIAGAIAAVSLAALFAIISLWIGFSQAVAARDEADETAKYAMGMVDQLLVRLNEETLLEQPGMQPLKADIYSKALASYEELLPKLQKSQRQPENIAMVQAQIGFVKMQLGQRDEGLKQMNLAAGSLEALHARDGENVKVLTNLSKVKTEIGRYYFNQRDYQAAAPPLQQALKLRAQLTALEPESTEAGQLLANSEMNVGLVEDSLGHSQEALVRYEAADSLRQTLLAKTPNDFGVLRDRAKGLANLGVFHATQGDVVLAEKFYTAAEKAFATLSARKDHQLDDLHDLGSARMRLGDLAAIRNTDADLQMAVKRYMDAVQDLDELVRANGTVRSYRGTLARARLNLAQLFAQQKNAHEAFVQLTIVFDELQQLRREDPAFDKYASKTFFEMLRLRKWKKLSPNDLQELTTWVDFATTENGQTWVKKLEQLADAAPEFPPALKLEESEMLMPHHLKGAKPGS